MIKSKHSEWRNVGENCWDHHTNDEYDGWAQPDYDNPKLSQYRWGALANDWINGDAPTLFLAKRKVLAILARK